MKFHIHRSESGLQIVRVPMSSVKSVTVLALVKVGSRYETSELGGISHFLEHMVFKGTEKYPTAQDVSVTVDAIGAEYNAFTSKEYTGYYVKSASKDVSIALDVVSDMLLTPRLRQDDIDREKGVILEEINMYEDTPMRHIGDVFEQMFYHGSPLGRDVIGTDKTVTTFQAKDFQNYLDTWYGLKNMVVLIVGDAEVVGKSEMVDQVTKMFSKGEIVKRRTPEALDLKANPISSEHTLQIVHKKTEQAHFILGFPGIKRTDPDRYALSVLSTALGGNMSSRLFTEVREKRGLCYYVHSDSDSYAETGFFGAAAGVDPQRVDEAIRVTLEEFTQLREKSHAMSNDEIKRAKDFTIGNLILGMEDSQNVALAYGMKLLLEGKILTLDEIISKIQDVTTEDVERVVERLIQPKQVRLAMIGPFEDEDRFRKLVD